MPSADDPWTQFWQHYEDYYRKRYFGGRETDPGFDPKPPEEAPASDDDMTERKEIG